MARKKKTQTKHPIESYEHRDKRRVNNPPVGLVTPDTDPDAEAKQIYTYDPHLDPVLSWDQQVGRKEIEERCARLRSLANAANSAFLEFTRAKGDNLTEEELQQLEESANHLIQQAAEAAAEMPAGQCFAAVIR